MAGRKKKKVDTETTNTNNSQPAFKTLKPRTECQVKYIEAIQNNDIVFAIGCAGTGKTRIACHMAAQWLMEGKVDKIVLTRPAVEAGGEQIGFLPGDVHQKLNPYLLPLYDFLNFILGKNTVNNMIEEGIIEIVPLGFVRGRTFEDAFVILDEGQNVNKTLMLSFLTRMGQGSKFVITGDLEQSDLTAKGSCGLFDAKQRLMDIDGIGWIEFSEADVVRHPLVKKIITRYREEPNIAFKSHHFDKK